MVHRVGVLIIKLLLRFAIANQRLAALNINRSFCEVRLVWGDSTMSVSSQFDQEQTPSGAFIDYVTASTCFVRAKLLYFGNFFNACR